MRLSPFDDLLGDEEVILWLAQARRQKDATVVAGMFLLFGSMLIAMASWMFIEGPGDPATTDSIGILAPIFAFSAGLFSVWLGLTGKGMLPAPTYAVSPKQAFIAENKTAGGILRSNFLLDRNQPVTVTGTGSRCHCRIPVIRESCFGRASVTFTYLTDLHTEALLRALEKAGEPSESGR